MRIVKGKGNVWAVCVVFTGYCGHALMNIHFALVTLADKDEDYKLANKIVPDKGILNSNAWLIHQRTRGEDIALTIAAAPYLR